MNKPERGFVAHCVVLSVEPRPIVGLSMSASVEVSHKWKPVLSATLQSIDSGMFSASMSDEGSANEPIFESTVANPEVLPTLMDSASVVESSESNELKSKNNCRSRSAAIDDSLRWPSSESQVGFEN